MHNDKGVGRELVWSAAMLHACGQHINLNSYHKHSWYLIQHGELLGYSQLEHLMVAAIARYHRKSLPKKRHESWQLITSKENRNTVIEMSLLLRLACSIDRRPESVLESIKISTNRNELRVELLPFESSQNLGLEKWSLKSCAIIVKQLTGVDLNVC